MKTGVPGGFGKRVRRRKARGPGGEAGGEAACWGRASKSWSPASAAAGRRVERGAASRSSGASQETAGVRGPNSPIAFGNQTIFTAGRRRPHARLTALCPCLTAGLPLSVQSSSFQGAC